MKRLKEIGYPFQPVRFVLAIVANLLDLLLNPKRTVEDWVRGHEWALKPVRMIEGKSKSAEAKLELSKATDDDPEHGHYVQL